MDYAAVFLTLTSDERYLANLDWGQPRQGHPEGTVQAHISELEQNLERLRDRLSDTEVWKLKLLIHTHDTFKPLAHPEVPITDANSHASLARSFLAEFCHDVDLLAMVQFHDVPFALWRQQKSKGRCSEERLQELLRRIQDWNLFSAFQIIDGCTAGKSRDPLRWWFAILLQRDVMTRFTDRDLL